MDEAGTHRLWGATRIFHSIEPCTNPSSTPATKPASTLSSRPITETSSIPSSIPTFEPSTLPSIAINSQPSSHQLRCQWNHLQDRHQRNWIIYDPLKNLITQQHKCAATVSVIQNHCMQTNETTNLILNETQWQQIDTANNDDAHNVPQPQQQQHQQQRNEDGNAAQPIVQATRCTMRAKMTARGQLTADGWYVTEAAQNGITYWWSRQQKVHHY